LPFVAFALLRFIPVNTIVLRTEPESSFTIKAGSAVNSAGRKLLMGLKKATPLGDGLFLFMIDRACGILYIIVANTSMGVSG
jgi:hypothetical protein